MSVYEELTRAERRTIQIVANASLIRRVSEPTQSASPAAIVVILLARYPIPLLFIVLRVTGYGSFFVLRVVLRLGPAESVFVQIFVLPMVSCTHPQFYGNAGAPRFFDPSVLSQYILHI